jgi:hypothetical protein
MLALPIVPSAPEAVVTVPRPTLKWYQVWLYALVPSIERYRQIATDDLREVQKGLLWLTLVNVVVSAAAAFVQGLMTSTSADSGPGSFRALILAAMMCFSGFFLTAFELVLPVAQFVMTLAMRGKVKLGTQLYTLLCLCVYLRALVFFLISIVPTLLQLPDTYETLIYLVAPVVAYSMVLNTIATKVNSGVGWIRVGLPEPDYVSLAYTGCLVLGSI